MSLRALLPTKATGKSQAELAQAVEQQCGRQSCPVTSRLSELAKPTAVTNAARSVHVVLRASGLARDIRITNLQGKCEGIPVILPSSMIDHLNETSNLHRLLGGHTPQEALPILRNYWSMFRKLYPMYYAFNDTFADVDLDRLIPCYTHLDEGCGHMPLVIYSVTLR
jgi:hypothetical protein